MPRPMTVSEAQSQLLETALDLYRMVYRLHRSREGLNWQAEIEREIYGEMEVSAEPPTIELAVADEIGTAIDEFLEIADRLQKASRATDVTIRREWRAEQKRRAK